MAELLDELIELKNITVNIINSLESDDVEKLESLFTKRERIIEEISKLHYESKEFALICNNIGMIELQNKVTNFLKEKMDSTKNEIKKIQLNRSANSDYNKSFYNNIKLFDKKI